MMSKAHSKRRPVRRQIANISILGTTQLHLRNPYIIGWWSAAFPGFGHLLLSKYIRGFLLFVGEVVINFQANINLAILYSFTGRFEMAKEVLNVEWLLLYVPIYIFTIWDGYRTTIDINHQYQLAVREDAYFEPFTIKPMEINYLDKRTPWVSAVWSVLIPGSGQFYIHRIIAASFLLIWWIFIVYYSKVLPGIHLSLLGRLEEAKQVLNPQWLLNLPSLLLFSMYDAYTNTVENNKLFDWEQAKFFKRTYRHRLFPMPLKSDHVRGESMYVLSTFEHSTYLELAISEIQAKGIAKENILAVAMEKATEKRKLFDSMHYSDGLSLIDLAAVLGCIFMLFGAIYGFILKWGPIWWGLIGLAFGFSLGLMIKLLIVKRGAKEQTADSATEVVLMIACREDQVDMVKNILLSHYALGMSQLDLR